MNVLDSMLELKPVLGFEEQFQTHKDDLVIDTTQYTKNLMEKSKLLLDSEYL